MVEYRPEVKKVKSTDELAHEIAKSTSILDYLAENRDEMQLDSLPEYLEKWLEQKGLKKSDVVQRSNLNRAYVYQIFLGKKYPSRDKVIALSFGLGLDAQETQTLLKQAGYRELYPRDPRDALLLFAVGKGMGIIEANELLYDHNIEVLEFAGEITERSRRKDGFTQFGGTRCRR